MRAVARFIILFVLLGFCVLLGRWFHLDLNSLRVWLEQYPLMISGVVFIVFYVAITSLVWFGPKDVLRVASALLFGPFWSTVFIYIGELFNAALLFHVSRKLGQEFVMRKMNISAERIAQLQHRSGFVRAMVFRLNPLIPFRLQDLAAGLSPITFSTYLTAIIIAAPIRTFWLQYIIAGVGESFLMPGAMNKYFLSHPGVLYASFGYVVVSCVLIFINMFYSKTASFKKN